MHRSHESFQNAIISSNDASLLRDFTLTIGVVSNHGNWFTSDDHNKELKVLAQSYDWLLFLTDIGLSQFVQTLLLEPDEPYKVIQNAFQQSYSGQKGHNRFTKVQIDLDADLALQEYFNNHLDVINSWFNIISPTNHSINELKSELHELASKNWQEILG